MIEVNEIGYPTADGGFDPYGSTAPKVDNISAQDVSYGNGNVKDALDGLNGRISNAKIWVTIELLTANATTQVSIPSGIFTDAAQMGVVAMPLYKAGTAYCTDRALTSVSLYFSGSESAYVSIIVFQKL